MIRHKTEKLPSGGVAFPPLAPPPQPPVGGSIFNIPPWKKLFNIKDIEFNFRNRGISNATILMNF